MAGEPQSVSGDLVERLDRIADLMALTLIRGLERDEQIRILSAVGYTPARIGTFLDVRANTVSVALTRARQRTSKPKKTAKPKRTTEPKASRSGSDEH